MSEHQPDWRTPTKRDLTDVETFVAATRLWPGAKSVARPTAYREARDFYESLHLQGITFSRWWRTDGEERYEKAMVAALALAQAWRDSGAPRSKAPNFGMFWYWVALRHQT